jgi:glycosyltransferase 2 family protein
LSNKFKQPLGSLQKRHANRPPRPLVPEIRAVEKHPMRILHGEATFERRWPLRNNIVFANSRCYIPPPTVARGFASRAVRPDDVLRGKPMRSYRFKWQVLAKATVSLLLIYFLLRNCDLGELARQIAAVDRSNLIAAIAILVLMAVPLTLRWWVILRAIGHPLRLWTLGPIVLIGQFFNQALPSSVGGDVMRIWQGYRAGLPASVAFSSVLIDRVVGLLAVCLLISATFALLLQIIPNPAIGAGVALLLIVGYFGVIVAMLFDYLPRSLRRLKLLDGAATLSANLRTTLLNASAAPLVLACGAICQLGTVMAVFLLARGLGLSLQMPVCLVIVPVVCLSTLLPISIGGWGVREGAFVAGFGLVGMPTADALALSVLLGLANVIFGLIGGGVWLAYRNESIARAPINDGITITSPTGVSRRRV